MSRPADLIRQSAQKRGNDSDVDYLGNGAIRRLAPPPSAVGWEVAGSRDTNLNF